MQLEFEVADEEAMVALGRRLGETLPAGLSVHLTGDLGAGKTTLTRGIARALGHEGAVKSPTYTLVEPYDALTPALYHFDLYRVADPGELELLGVRDYFSGTAVVVVEWPERGGEFLPAPDLEISIAPEGTRRTVLLRARSAVAEQCLVCLRGAT